MELWNKIEAILIKLWNKLYEFLIGDILGEEINPDFFIPEEE